MMAADTDNGQDLHPLEQAVALLAPEQAARLADLFKALSDPTRVRLMAALTQTPELCVNDLSALLEMEQSAVSHQLAYLRAMRLLRVRRAGRHNFYALDDDHILRLFEQGLDHVRHG